jgi:hypothetical protein
MRVSLGNAGLRPLLAFVAALGVLTAGCSLDKVQDPPPLVGPAETGISVQLTALPDTVNADGVSQSTVQLVLRYSDGSPFSGLAVYFAHDGDGVLQPSASSTYVGPVQTGIVMATDGNGVANVVYTAGTGLGTVTVFVRPYNIDGASFFERTVEILQR